ncbi:MAG: hypothetical protein PVI86_07295 [Phycisphaerae bacterium]|jgi:hypothetical protein
MTPLTLLNFVVVAIVIAGVLARRKPRVHVPLMCSALVIDVAMVLYLELTRAVVETLPARPMTPLLAIHIVISVLVLVLYGVQVATGIGNLRGRRSNVHRRVMIWFLLMRVGNAVTSVLVMQQQR